MSAYTIIAVKEDIEREKTNNLFEAKRLIEKYQSSGKKVYVAHGPIQTGNSFIERVKRIYI